MTQLSNSRASYVDRFLAETPPVNQQVSYVDQFLDPSANQSQFISSNSKPFSPVGFTLTKLSDLSRRGYRLAGKKDRGLIAEAVAGFESAFGQGLQGAGGLLQMAGAERLGETLSDVGTLEAGLFPPSDDSGFGLRKIVYTVAQATPQMAQAVGAGVATGGLGTAASVAAFAATSAAPVVGQTYDEAKRDWISRGYSEENAELYAGTEAIVVGTLSGLLEKIPGGAIFTKSKAGQQALTKAIIGKARQVGVAALAEGSTETLQGIVEDAGKFWIREDGTAFDNAIERRALEFITGAVMGGSSKMFVGDAPAPSTEPTPDAELSGMAPSAVQSPTNAALTIQNNERPDSDTPSTGQPTGDTSVNRSSPDSTAIGAMASGEVDYSKTGTTKDARQLERERFGIPDPLQSAKYTDQQALDRANEIIGRNPDAPQTLVDDLAASQRPATKTERAMLLVHYQQVKQEHLRVNEELDAARQRGDKAAELDLMARESALYDQRYDLEEVLEASGSESGRSLQAIKMFINQDFTLASMSMAVQRAQGGKPLSAEQHAEIKGLHDKIASLQEQLVQSREKASQEKMQSTFDKMVKKAEKKKKPPATTPEQLLAQHNPAKAKPAQKITLIEKLARLIVELGERDRDVVVKAVHKFITQLYPSMTEAQVRDAISGYGDFKQIKKDAVSVALRDIKTQLQLVAKIEALNQGVAPLKTGFERQEMSDEARQLTQQYNELKKSLNITVTDPARQLKSALAAIKTRLKNSIKDLEKQIATKTKIVKTKADQPSDAETVALTAQRDAIKEQFNAIFGKPKMTEAQRAEAARRAVERSIADLERRIKEADFVRDQKKQSESPALSALRARRDDLLATFKELATLDPDAIADKEARELAQVKKRLTKRNAELRDKIAKRDFHKKAKKPGPKLDAEAQSLQLAVNTLQDSFREQVNEIRGIERLTKSNADMRQMLTTGNVPPKPTKAEKTLSDVRLRLQIENEQLRRQVDRVREQNAPKSALSWTWRIGSDVLNTMPRIFSLGTDFGQVLNQGKFLLHHPIIMARNLYPMMKSFIQGGPEVENQVMADIRAHPLWPMSHEARLDLTHEDADITHQEELFQSFILDKIPGIKQVSGFTFKRFASAYRVFMNKVRFDTFVRSMQNMSRTGQPTKDEAKDIARFINVASGRGAISHNVAAATVVANHLVLATRFQVSRVQFLLGLPVLMPAYRALRGQGSWRSTRHIAKEYVQSLAAMATYYTIVHMATAFMAEDDDEYPTIEIDPRSADFLKIKIGDTRIDPMAGVQQWAVMGARLGRSLLGGDIADTAVTSLDGDERAMRGDDLLNFYRNRAAPLAGAFIDRIRGYTPDHREATLGHLFANMYTPISFKDTLAGFQEYGFTKASALGFLALFGERVAHYIREQQSRQRKHKPSAAGKF